MKLILPFILPFITTFAGIALLGWMTTKAARRWAPSMEDPAAVVLIVILGLSTWFIGRLT